MGLEKEDKKSRGWIFLALWAVLIVIGIVEKRFFNHPDRMAFFHLPAAVCLVIALRELSRNFRKKYEESVQDFQRERLNANR